MRRFLRRAAGIGGLALVLIGCTSTPAPTESWADGTLPARPGSATIELSQFCTRMLDLERRNLDDQRLVVEYQRLLPIAPTEIAVEFEALINELDSGSVPATSEFDPEAPGSIEAVAVYVDNSCRLTAVSPLPAPTAPSEIEP